MAKLFIIDEKSYIELKGGETKIIVKPFNIHVIGSAVLINNNIRINFDAYDEVYIDNILQSSILLLYLSLKNIVKLGTFTNNL